MHSVYEYFAAFVWFTPPFPSLSPVFTMWYGYCFVCNTDAQYTNNSILLGMKRIIVLLWWLSQPGIITETIRTILVGTILAMVAAIILTPYLDPEFKGPKKTWVPKVFNEYARESFAWEHPTGVQSPIVTLCTFYRDYLRIMSGLHPATISQESWYNYERPHGDYAPMPEDRWGHEKDGYEPYYSAGPEGPWRWRAPHVYPSVAPDGTPLQVRAAAHEDSPTFIFSSNSRWFGYTFHSVLLTRRSRPACRAQNTF